MSKVSKFLNLYGAYIKSHFVPGTLSVRIIPTDRCNLRCSYCWQRTDDSREMTIEEFNAYLAKARKMNVGIITFLGGEPMMWPALYDAIAGCTRANVLTDLTTNGTLLNGDSIERLGHAGLDYLNISVDGLKPTEVTRKNSIVREDILAKLKAARRKHGMHFRVNSVIYKNNFEQIKELIDFVKENNVQISLGFVVEPFDKKYAVAPEIYFGLEDEELLRDIVNYVIMKRRQGYPIIDPEEYFTGVFRYLRREKFWDCNYPTRYGWINVIPNGKVRSCTKKMDELDYSYLDLDRVKLAELRKVLAAKVQKCNAECYSNCAFDSYFYAHNKRAFLKKVADRMVNNYRMKKQKTGKI
jgi:MoaA/NifB/PqqE/SkfB family radical SAM enzyme